MTDTTPMPALFPDMKTDEGLDPSEFAAIAEYGDPVAPPHTTALLREPSEAMVEAVALAISEIPMEGSCEDMARAAIAAVLKEIEG